MSAQVDVERDGPVRWVEPFAGMYWRIRFLSWLLAGALLAMFVQGYWLYRLSVASAAHVYQVEPDGTTTYVGDRTANVFPRQTEMLRTARQFIECLFGWNSSTVAYDFARAVNMASAEMGEQLRSDLASAGAINILRQRQIRSELRYTHIELVETSQKHARVRLAGEIEVYGLTQYEGSPQQIRDFSVEVTLEVLYCGGIVCRDPERRPAGLEVVRLSQIEMGT